MRRMREMDTSQSGTGLPLPVAGAMFRCTLFDSRLQIAVGDYFMPAALRGHTMVLKQLGREAGEVKPQANASRTTAPVRRDQGSCANLLL